MGSKGGGKAPAPDQNIGIAARENVQLGKDWLSFAREQFQIGNERQQTLDDLTAQVTGEQLAGMRDANERSTAQWERYNSLFVPVENRMVQEAMDFDTPERQAAMAAEAKADVQNAIAGATQQRARQQAAMGINPNSGRFQGIDRSTALQGALASAGAQNTAREQVRRTGMALREGVANFGRGATSVAAQQAGLGLSSGNSAVNNQMGAEGNFRANAGIMGQGFSGAIGANNSAAGILNQQYGNQLNAWSANQQAGALSASNLMSGIGTAAGAAAAFGI